MTLIATNTAFSNTEKLYGDFVFVGNYSGFLNYLSSKNFIQLTASYIMQTALLLKTMINVAKQIIA